MLYPVACFYDVDIIPYCAIHCYLVVHKPSSPMIFFSRTKLRVASASACSMLFQAAHIENLNSFSTVEATDTALRFRDVCYLVYASLETLLSAKPKYGL